MDQQHLLNLKARTSARTPARHGGAGQPVQRLAWRLTQNLARHLAVAGLLTGSALALATQISLRPSFLKVHTPQNFAVDVVVSDLSQQGPASLIGSFDLAIGFDIGKLSLLSALTTFGTGLGDPHGGLESIAGQRTATPGQVSIYQVSLLESSLGSCFYCAGPYLEDLQGTSFVLATLTFYAPAQPHSFSPINLLSAPSLLGDADGNAISGVSYNSMVVEMPEPATLGLLLLALAGLALVPARRAQARSQKQGAAS